MGTEVHNNVQEAVIKTIPKKKTCKRGKLVVDKALQIAEKTRKVKGKGEKESYIHMNAEFRRIPRRDNRAFLSEQRKEIEENNRMGKTRDLFKEIRDTKGIFHVKMGTVTKAEDTKKRWQEYTKELYKKGFNEPNNPPGVIVHLEPDFPECEVEWASGRFPPSSGGDGIPVALFQVLKNDTVEMLYAIFQQIWKTQQWAQDWNMLVFIPNPKKGNAKEGSNYHTVHSFHKLAR